MSESRSRSYFAQNFLIFPFNTSVHCFAVKHSKNSCASVSESMRGNVSLRVSESVRPRRVKG